MRKAGDHVGYIFRPKKNPSLLRSADKSGGRDQKATEGPAGGRGGLTRGLVLDRGSSEGISVESSSFYMV